MTVANKLKKIFAKSNVEEAMKCSILEYYGIESEKDIDGVILSDDIRSRAQPMSLVSHLSDLLVAQDVVIGLDGEHSARKTLYYIGIKDAVPDAMLNPLVIYADSLSGDDWIKIERHVKAFNS